jgi:hypothetical protein
MQLATIADEKQLCAPLIAMKNVGGCCPNRTEPRKRNTFVGCNVGSRIGSLDFTWHSAEQKLV